MTKAEGYFYSQETRDWTERREFVAKSYMEAIRWINFNRDYAKRLRIVPTEGKGE